MLGLVTALPKYLIFIDIYDVLTQESQFLKFFSVFRNPLYTETVELIFVISLGLGKINLRGGLEFFGQCPWKMVWGWKEMKYIYWLFPLPHFLWFPPLLIWCHCWCHGRLKEVGVNGKHFVCIEWENVNSWINKSWDTSLIPVLPHSHLAKCFNFSGSLFFYKVMVLDWMIFKNFFDTKIFQSFWKL